MDVKVRGSQGVFHKEAYENQKTTQAAVSGLPFSHTSTAGLPDTLRSGVWQGECDCPGLAKQRTGSSCKGWQSLSLRNSDQRHGRTPGDALLGPLSDSVTLGWPGEGRVYSQRGSLSQDKIAVPTFPSHTERSREA